MPQDLAPSICVQLNLLISTSIKALVSRFGITVMKDAKQLMK